MDTGLANLQKVIKEGKSSPKGVSVADLFIFSVFLIPDGMPPFSLSLLRPTNWQSHAKSYVCETAKCYHKFCGSKSSKITISHLNLSEGKRHYTNRERQLSPNLTRRNFLIPGPLVQTKTGQDKLQSPTCTV